MSFPTIRIVGVVNRIIPGDTNRVSYDTYYHAMRLYYDNKFAISIVHNPIQHDRTKHIGSGQTFIKEKLDSDMT